jgi:predicted transcriptional regulator of viral defense system
MQYETEWNQNDSPTDRVRRAVKQGRLVESSDLEVPPAILSRLAQRGELNRVRRGVYLGSKIDPHPLYEAAAVVKRTPRAVVGLLTALEYYRLTTSWPDGVWVLVPRDRNPPQGEVLHVVRVLPKFLDLSLGIDTLEVHGVTVKITDPTRSVLDCWKHTRRVSGTVALEALRELRISDHWNGRSLYRLARRLGVWTRLRPYVEALG